MLYPIVGPGNLQGLIDRNGEVVVPPIHLQILERHEGLAAVRTNDGRGIGFIDEQGRWAIEPQFTRVSRFCEGLCMVWHANGGGTSVIDTRGARVFDLEEQPYLETLAFSHGLLAVTRNGKTGYVDPQGALVIPHRYEYAKAFREGVAAVASETGVGYIDTEGRWAIEPRFHRGYAFHDGGAGVVSSDKALRKLWGVIDREGAYRHEPAFDFKDLEIEPAFVEGRSIVKQGKQWGFVRTDGSLAGSVSYEKVCAFSEGLAAVKKKVKGKAMWGFIDTDGELAIAPQFTDVLWPVAGFSEGTCPVGVSATPAQLAAFQKLGMYTTAAFGYIDTKGNFMLEPRYFRAGPFRDGLAYVGTETGWAYIDTAGKTVWSATSSLP